MLLSSLDSLDSLVRVQLIDCILIICALLQISICSSFLYICTLLFISYGSWTHHFANRDIGSGLLSLPTALINWSSRIIGIILDIAPIILFKLLIIRLEATQAIADKGTKSSHACSPILIIVCVFFRQLAHWDVLSSTVYFWDLLLCDIWSCAINRLLRLLIGNLP